jgi:hypothetical protein
MFLGIVFLCGLLFVHRNSLLVFSGIKTEGFVVETTYEMSHGGKNRTLRTPSTKIYYKDNSGAQYTLVETGQTNVFWSDGQSVSVYYDSNEPSRATTFTFRKIVSFLTLLSFCVMFLIAIAVVVKKKK